MENACWKLEHCFVQHEGSELCSLLISRNSTSPSFSTCVFPQPHGASQRLFPQVPLLSPFHSQPISPPECIFKQMSYLASEASVSAADFLRTKLRKHLGIHLSVPTMGPGSGQWCHKGPHSALPRITSFTPWPTQSTR